jgi:hypothetical protein
MISKLKGAATRKQPCRSTGPRKSASKGCANRNARRHGLAVPIRRAPGVLAEIDRLAMILAGSRREPAALEQARIAAAAELELLRVRAYRQFVIENKTAQAVPHHRPAVLDDKRDPSASEDLNQEQNASAIAGVLPDLAALDRYEKRALSRRKRAMRWLMYTTVSITP